MVDMPMSDARKRLLSLNDVLLVNWFSFTGFGTVIDMVLLLVGHNEHQEEKPIGRTQHSHSNYLLSSQVATEERHQLTHPNFVLLLRRAPHLQPPIAHPAPHDDHPVSNVVLAHHLQLLKGAGFF